MKTIREIVAILIVEILNRIDDIRLFDKKVYYNKDLGDISFLLAGLLQSLLNEVNNWDKSKWFDDSLITNVTLDNEKLIFNGIMIFGKENTTEQWTEPFSFEILLHTDKSNFKEYTFFFSHKNIPEITYEEYNKNRSYWKENTKKNWKYVINQKVSEILLY